MKFLNVFFLVSLILILLCDQASASFGIPHPGRGLSGSLLQSAWITYGNQIWRNFVLPRLGRFFGFLSIEDKAPEESTAKLSSEVAGSDTKLSLKNYTPFSDEVFGIVSEIPENPIVLGDNFVLNLGDVISDSKGKSYFFIQKLKKTNQFGLLELSAGSQTLKDSIANCHFLKSSNTYGHRHLNYSEDLFDSFTVIQEYDGMLLIKSAANSVYFVAPQKGLKRFLKEEYLQKLKPNRSRNGSSSGSPPHPSKHSAEPSTSPVGSANVSKSFKLHNALQVRVLAARDNLDIVDQNSYSPDSVVDFDLMEIGRLKDFFNPMQDNTDALTGVRVKFIKDVICKMFKKDQMLTIQDAMILISGAEGYFRHEKFINEVTIGEGEMLTIVGDIHGQFMDLLQILTITNLPDSANKFIFNGDIVDRGDKSLECLLLLCALKITFPKSVFINRGNHEDSLKEQFYWQCARVIDPTHVFFSKCQNFFKSLPLAQIVNGKVFVAHGGIDEEMSVEGQTLRELAPALDRFNPDQRASRFMYSLMWNDPSSHPGMTANVSRGELPKCFGPDVTARFLERNNLVMMVRSHTFIQKGIEMGHNDKILTVFSAPNYCRADNTAAILQFDHKLKGVGQFYGAHDGKRKLVL